MKSMIALRIVTISLFFLIGSLDKIAAQPVQKMTPEIKQLLNNYYFSIESADQQKALITLTALIEADSTYAPYYAARASVSIYSGFTDTAFTLNDLSQAVKYDASNITYYKQRANYNWKLATESNLHAAASDYAIILKTDTFYLEAYQNLYTFYTVVEFKSGRTARKIEKSAQKALKMEVYANPFVAESYFRLGHTYLLRTSENVTKSAVNKAIAAFGKAIAIDSINTKYLFERSLLLYRFKKDYNAAISDLNKVISLKPDASAYYYKAICLKMMHKTEDALAVIEAGLKQFPNDDSLNIAKNEIYLNIVGN